MASDRYKKLHAIERDTTRTIKPGVEHAAELDPEPYKRRIYHRDIDTIS